MEFESEAWYQFLDEGMRDLVNLSYSLLDAFSLQPSALGLKNIHDYSFVVFPMAKAYEGFLKKWFFTNDFIKEYQYKGDHFRIGKALNPSLPARFKREGYVYDQIVAGCPDPHLGDKLWSAWKSCRNLVFHYFPHHMHFITLGQAKDRIDQVVSAMRAATLCMNALPEVSRRTIPDPIIPLREKHPRLSGVDE